MSKESNSQDPFLFALQQQIQHLNDLAKPRWNLRWQALRRHADYPQHVANCLEAIQSDLEGLRRQQSEVLSRLRGHDLFAVFPKADTFTIIDRIIPAAFSRQGPQAAEYGTPSTLPELLHFLADFAPDEWQSRSLPKLLKCAETFLALRSGLYRITRMIKAHENALKADAALKRWWSTYKGDERFVDLPSRDQPPELVEVNEIFGHVQYENNSEVQGQQTKLVPSLTELREKTGASFPVDPDITAMPIAAWAALFPDEPGYQIKEHYNRTSSPELSLQVHRKNLGAEIANVAKEFARQVQTEGKKTALDIPTQDKTFTIYDMKKEGRSDVDIAQAIWPDEYKKARGAQKNRDTLNPDRQYDTLIQRVADRYKSVCEWIEQSTTQKFRNLNF